MAAQEFSELWLKSGKLYVDDTVEAVVHSRGIHNDQLPPVGVQDGTRTSALNRKNEDPPGGRHQRQDRTNVGPKREGELATCIAA